MSAICNARINLAYDRKSFRIQFRENGVAISAVIQTIPFQNLRGFPQSLEEGSVVIVKLSQERFLPRLLPFIIHCAAFFRRCTDSGTEVIH